MNEEEVWVAIAESQDNGTDVRTEDSDDIASIIIRAAVLTAVDVNMLMMNLYNADRNLTKIIQPGHELGWVAHNDTEYWLDQVKKAAAAVEKLFWSRQVMRGIVWTGEGRGDAESIADWAASNRDRIEHLNVITGAGLDVDDMIGKAYGEVLQ